MVSTVRGGSRVVHAEMARDGETHSCRVTQRLAKAAAAPSTVGISNRLGGGGMREG